jgi:predicted nuclease with TOPRIM domain
MFERFKDSKEILERLDRIESAIQEIQDKQKCMLMDIVRLEEECVEQTNMFYELDNSVRALDARIDTVALEFLEDRLRRLES